MELALSRIHHPVTTLGYGCRVGIWFQGCSIHCKGCIVPDTWRATSRHRVKLEWVQKAVVPLLARSDGVTISGGEPFDQPEALMELLRWIDKAMDGDVLLYSGYQEPELRSRYPEAFDLVDVMVLNPFKENLPDTRPFIGSSNQRLLLLTALARKRYRQLEEMPRGFTVDFQKDEILMAGVPGLNFMSEFKTKLRQSGIEVSDHE